MKKLLIFVAVITILAGINMMTGGGGGGGGSCMAFQDGSTLCQGGDGNYDQHDGYTPAP